MSKTPTFVIDENPDIKDATRAYRHLRRMVRLGKIAEKALSAIDIDGFYDGNTPIATSRDRIENVRFHKRLDISRDDLGDMSELQIKLGRQDDNEITLFMTGPMAFQVDTKPSYEIRPDERRIGVIRLNKNAIKWHDGRNGKIYRIYREMKYDGAKESLEAFSRCVSSSLVKEVDNDDEPYKRCAKTVDLQDRSWEWFLQDGHAERMFLDILRLVSVYQVMEK